MTMAMMMMMAMMMTISSMWWVGAAGDVDTGSILHPATHNFHQTFKTSAHTQFSQKNTKKKIHSLPDFLKKLWILNFPPSSQRRKVEATWAGPFWAKTLELELLDKSIISQAHISITIQAGPPPNFQYLSPISQSRRLVMMNQPREEKLLIKSNTEEQFTHELLIISHEKFSVSFQNSQILFSSSALFFNHSSYINRA